eukprot:Clim_evm2s196 gene=Clim_evmTU2s196
MTKRAREDNCVPQEVPQTTTPCRPPLLKRHSSQTLARETLQKIRTQEQSVTFKTDVFKGSWTDQAPVHMQEVGGVPVHKFIGSMGGY